MRLKPKIKWYNTYINIIHQELIGIIYSSIVTLYGKIFSPKISALIQVVIIGFFRSYPGLIVWNIKKYIRAPTSTILGHLDD